MGLVLTAAIMSYLEAMGTSARLAPGRLAEEQAALRRVATLVARGASAAQVFAAVAQEVAQVLHLDNAAVCRYDDEGTVMTVLAVWGERPDMFHPGSRWPLRGASMSAQVLRTGRPARIDDYTNLPGSLASAAREHGFSRVAGAPIMVDGRVWGVISTGSPDAPLADDLEDRLGEFTELVATAIANSEAHEELSRLAEEQAALRRVATLVAEGAAPPEVFAAVSAEVARLAPADGAAITRFESDGTVTALGGWSSSGEYPYVGRRFALAGTVSGRVFATRRPARVERYEDAPGSALDAAREMGWQSSVGVPITVGGRLWGVLAVISRSEHPLPGDTERRLAEFTELVGTAIANAESGVELRMRSDEQAALRRVATLVARGGPPAEILDAVAAEVGRLLGADWSAVHRYDADGAVTALSSSGVLTAVIPVGTRTMLEPESLSAAVQRSGRSARRESFEGVPGLTAAQARALGVRSAVAAPITVEGRLWGVMIAAWRGEGSVPVGDAEGLLAGFTELAATAIANAESREELAWLAEGQAALRRVATVVANSRPPAEVFEAMIAEVGQLFPADAAYLARYATDGTITVLGGWRRESGYRRIQVGQSLAVERETAAGLVLETQRPARIGDYEGVPGASARAAREMGWRSSLGVPITVEGRVWGVLVVASTTEQPLPLETEVRLAEFAELLATAIANSETRAELDASRARIVATADATRRRIERDLHDGAQQELVSLALELRAAQAAAPPELREHRAELSHAVERLTSVLDGLREIALGIHPAILAEGGLGPALKTLAHRSPIPVSLDVGVQGRLPEAVEVTTYYVVSEALTNAAKHAHASSVEVSVERGASVLRVTVRDNGAGGADPDRGTGLLGLRDRAEAIGGTICVESARGEGTSLVAELPLDGLRR